MLKEHEGDLVALGVGGLAKFVALIGAGRTAEAKEQILEALENATFEQLMAASDAASEATLLDAESREAAWQSMKRLGADLAQKVLPLLLMAL